MANRLIELWAGDLVPQRVALTRTDPATGATTPASLDVDAKAWTMAGGVRPGAARVGAVEVAAGTAAADGIAVVVFAPGDTDLHGEYDLVITLTKAGIPETFPGDGPIRVRIKPKPALPSP